MPRRQRLALAGFVGPVDDGILDRADALDLAAHPVARLEEDRRIPEDADARRRPGGDDVARLERDRAADGSMSSGDVQIMSAVVPSCIRISPAGVRAGARDPPRSKAEGLGIRDLVGGHEDRAHRQERVGALGPQPLTVADLALAEGGRDALPVAGADVVDDDVARDMVERVRARDPMGPSSR